MQTRPWRGSSISQISTYRLSPRKWWFQKILKLPEGRRASFDYGNALHKLCENYLSGYDDPFLGDWDANINIQEAQHIKTQVLFAIESGILARLPDALGAEKKFQLPVHPALPKLYGVMDYCTASGLVVDHKTVASRKWAKSSLDLQTDPQLMIYATVLGGLYLKPEARPEVYMGRHNNFSKSSLDDVWSTQDVIYTVDALEQNFTECSETMFKMSSDSKATNWQDVSCSKGCAKAFGGCPFKAICSQQNTVEEHIKQVMEQSAFAAALTTKEPETQGPNMTSAFERLKQMKASGAPAAQVVATAPALEAAGTAAAPTAPPAALHPDGLGGPAPWANVDCVSCQGSGWASKHPVPCRICCISTKQRGVPAPSLFNVVVSSSGVPTAVPRGDGVNGTVSAEPSPAFAPAVPPSDPPATVVVEATPTTAPLAGVARMVKGPKLPMATLMEETPDEEELIPEEANETEGASFMKGYVLCIGTIPCITSEGGFRPRAVLGLTDLVFNGELGDAIAKVFKKNTYAEAPALKRQDTLLAVAPNWVETNCGGCILVSTDSNPEIKALAELLSTKADATFRSVS